MFYLTPLTMPETTPECSPVATCSTLPEVGPEAVESKGTRLTNKPGGGNKSTKCERVRIRNWEQSRKNKKKRVQEAKESGRDLPLVREKA